MTVFLICFKQIVLGATKFGGALPPNALPRDYGFNCIYYHITVAVLLSSCFLYYRHPLVFCGIFWRKMHYVFRSEWSKLTTIQVCSLLLLLTN